VASYRLVDRHEPPGQQTKAAGPLGFRRQLRLDAGDGLQSLRGPQAHHRIDARGAHDRGLFQFARQEQVIRAAGDHADAHARAIDILVRARRRLDGQHVDAFDDDVRVGEGDFRGALRVDREEADVPRPRLQAFEDVPRLLIRNAFESCAEALRELARDVGGNSARRARRGIASRKHRITEVDRSAQRATGGEVGDRRGRGRGRSRG
jgi:hypothetical protein